MKAAPFWTTDLSPAIPGGSGVDCDSARQPESFWYSRRELIAFLILLVLVVIPISALIPPLQSPDESPHIKRAYLLSKGSIFLETVDGQTGGNIDKGLLTYMEIFNQVGFNYEKKITQEMLLDVRKIGWSGQTQFSGLPNIAVYLPFSYLPQAMAIFIGEHSGLSVNDTYYLARALALVAIVLMLWAAYRLYPVPVPVTALFLTPMTLFQLGSASLDGVSFSMTVLAGSLFMRAADRRREFGSTMHAALIVCLLLLATSRTNLIAVTWLPLVLFWIRRRSSYLISTGMLMVLALTWTAYATLTVHGTQIQDTDSITILTHYFTHFGELCSVLFATWTSEALLLGYWRMFVGVLGCLDTPLDPIVYPIFALSFAVLAAVSVQTRKALIVDLAHLSLAVAAVLATVLMFVLFLATYTMYPSPTVEAIQGRYFYPAAILLGFALFDRRMSQGRIRIGAGVLLFMVTFSIMCTAPKLILRYWAG